ncbi:MAG: histidine phosphatase family protein [Marinoscillum sp.]
MKKIYIIRHAKSSWSFDLEDTDRPLGVRGRRDAPFVGKFLSENEPTPDLMISSPASRALYTALLIADEWGYPEDDIIINSGLYHSSAEKTLEILSNIRDNISSVAIFGHNPGFTDLVNHFATEYLDNLPTAGTYIVTLEVSSWKKIKDAKIAGRELITPKKLPR